MPLSKIHKDGNSNLNYMNGQLLELKITTHQIFGGLTEIGNIRLRPGKAQKLEHRY